MLIRKKRNPRDKRDPLVQEKKDMLVRNKLDMLLREILLHYLVEQFSDPPSAKLAAEIVVPYADLDASPYTTSIRINSNKAIARCKVRSLYNEHLV